MSSKLFPFEIVVRTSEADFAGTDADVYIKIKGKEGSSGGWLYLDDDKNNFEKGSTDTFYFNLPYMGSVEKAWIKFVPMGENSPWLLSTISVNYIHKTNFYYYDWIKKKGEYELRRI